MTRRTSWPLRQRVAAESRNQCAYCHTLTSITGARLVIDHIIPEATDGQAVRENLCVACHSCNEFKGAQVEAKDPLTGRHVRLFHPRQQLWSEHFC
jgi:5-methylcytosine-specific restriction endonuclease McrA